MEMNDEGALNPLAALIDKSLLLRAETGGTRYAMLEVIREFGRERLVAAGEADAVARLHAAYYLTLAESIAAEALPGDQIIRLDSLEADHDNVRAAFDQLEVKGTAEKRLRLATACAPY
ncbi:MAG: AfsR family transcriptional regulator, partial [Gammaproteobacteria bacterium]